MKWLRRRVVDLVNRLRWMRAYRTWSEEHPSEPFSAFYVEQVAREIERSNKHKTLSVEFSAPETANAGADFVAKTLVSLGLQRSDTCVDFGCGALRVGAEVMTMIEPGNYIGLDVTDSFWKNGIERLGQDFIDVHRPRLELIDDDRRYEHIVDDPSFVIAIAVLTHVPPWELAEFFNQLARLMGPSSILVLDARLSNKTRRVHARSWEFSLAQVSDAARTAGLSITSPEPLRSDIAEERLLTMRKQSNV